MLQLLSSLEFFVLAAFSAAALVIALWSAARALAASGTPRTGEIIWSIVATAMLGAVAAAVRLGAGNGI